MTDPLAHLTRNEILNHADRWHAMGKTTHSSLAYTNAANLRDYARRKWPDDHRRDIIAAADRIEAKTNWPEGLSRAEFLKIHGIS